MAKASGRQAQAEQLLTAWQDRTEHFQDQARTHFPHWPLSVSILSFRADHARIYYSGFTHYVLSDLGFTRPANQQREGWGIKLTSQESIPMMNADLIFIFMRAEDPAVQRTYEQWTRHPLWQSLDAVKNKRVFVVDPVIWNMGAGILAANKVLDDVYRHFQMPLPDASASADTDTKTSTETDTLTQPSGDATCCALGGNV